MVMIMSEVVLTTNIGQYQITTVDEMARTTISVDITMMAVKSLSLSREDCCVTFPVAPVFDINLLFPINFKCHILYH